MGRNLRFASALAALASLATLALAPATMMAAAGAVECGLFRDYTAPDPVGVTAGTITFGLSGTPEPIAADALLVPPADTALPSLQGGVPTCLDVTRDAGVITSLGFAPMGTVTGTVLLVPDLFGPGQDAYVIADRIFAPADAVAADPSLAALVKTAADSGSTFSVTFQIDVSVGAPTGFIATTTFSGPVTLLPGGDVQVGAATLPGAVITDEARSTLQEAVNQGVEATVVVHGVGTFDQSSGGGASIAITLSVTLPPPPVVADTASARPGEGVGLPMMAGLAVVLLLRVLTGAYVTVRLPRPQVGPKRRAGNSAR